MRIEFLRTRNTFRLSVMKDALRYTAALKLRTVMSTNCAAV
jgi:hypothetical protein